MADKTYIADVFCKEVKTKYGRLMNVSIGDVDAFIEQLNALKKGNQIRFTIAEKKNPTPQTTHSMFLNEFEPRTP